MNNNKIYETIKMETRYYWVSGKDLGYLELKHLPVPGSIVVYLQGQLIEPETFDEYGNPIISEEMTKLFTAKKRIACRNDPKNNPTEDIYARVCYEPMEFTIPQDEFDSVYGIEKSLKNLKDFNTMLANRRRYLKAFGDKVSLSEYIIWGRYILGVKGEIYDWKGSIKNTSTNEVEILTNLKEIHELPDVCETSILNTFLKDNEILSYGLPVYIPTTESICPICGRKISMYDFRTKTFLRTNGKYCHEKCLDEYNKELQFERIIDLIDEVYDGTPKYTIVENKSFECLTLSFETPDGNIEIQDSFGSVAIEWQENFKPFDMAIFEKEQELKWWCKNDNDPVFLGYDIPKNIFNKNKRGILARHNYDKASIYLSLVKETVNETK